MVPERRGPARDWQGSYDEFRVWPSAAFAWEFFRRKAGIDEAFARCIFDEQDSRSGLRVVHVLDNQAIFPCLWASSSDLDAAHTAVAWLPALSRRVLRGVALPAKVARGATIFDPDQFDLEKTLLTLPDGSQELLLRDGYRTLQIHVIGGTLGAGDALVIDMAGTQNAPAQLNALAAYRELHTSGILLNKYFPPDPHAVRNAMCLQALDGFNAGVQHRLISEVIFGARRTAEDWRHPDRHLRDRVRRAFTRGRYMANTGYLGLLN
jgi:hypothetical protein